MPGDMRKKESEQSRLGKHSIASKCKSTKVKSATNIKLHVSDAILAITDKL